MGGPRVAFVRDILTRLMEESGGPTERRALIRLSGSTIAGWLIKLGAISPAPSPPEGLENKGFMADREVERPTPVASDATLGKETAARIIANHMMDEYEWPRKPAESLGAILETLLDWTFSDGSLESQEKAPETSSVGDKQ